MVDSLMKDDSIIKVPVLAEHIIESFTASKETGIHIWDFLCFVPLKNYVEIIYSLDRHFLEIGKRYKSRESLLISFEELDKNLGIET